MSSCQANAQHTQKKSFTSLYQNNHQPCLASFAKRIYFESRLFFISRQRLWTSTSAFSSFSVEKKSLKNSHAPDLFGHFERAEKIGLSTMGLGKPYFIGVFQRQSNLKIGLLLACFEVEMAWLCENGFGAKEVTRVGRCCWCLIFSRERERDEMSLSIFSNGLHPHHHHHNDPEVSLFSRSTQTLYNNHPLHCTLLDNLLGEQCHL